jgi:hypothetical protein
MLNEGYVYQDSSVLSKMVEIFCINLKNETIFILFKISVRFGFSR